VPSLTAAAEPIESVRLILSSYADRDIDALFEIHSDSRVGTFTFSPTESGIDCGGIP